VNCILIQLLLPSLVTALIVACCVDEEEHNIDRDTTEAKYPVSMEMVLDVQEQETPHAEMAERICELLSALAQKDAEMVEKLAEKDAEKDAEMAEKDAEKNGALAQKDAIIAERDAIIACAAQHHSS
jgi:hypothetical protein